MAVRHAFTVEEWHRMGETSLFGEDARLELLDGEVIEMPRISSRHASCVMELTRLLVQLVANQAAVSTQNPVQLDEHSEPQPDIAVLVPRADKYARSHPSPAETLLVIEVSDSSLAFDRDLKARRYASVGVLECWIVDLIHEEVLVMRRPATSGYRDVRAARVGDRIGPEALDGLDLEVAEILGAS
jgi:Uma2 family endonuclease